MDGAAEADSGGTTGDPLDSVEPTPQRLPRGLIVLIVALAVFWVGFIAIYAFIASGGGPPTDDNRRLCADFREARARQSVSPDEQRFVDELRKIGSEAQEGEAGRGIDFKARPMRSASASTDPTIVAAINAVDQACRDKGL